MADPATPHALCLVGLSSFSLMSLAAVIDPMRAANRILGVDVYSWRLTTVSGRPARASSGLEVSAAGSFEEAPRAELTLVLGGLIIDPAEARAVVGPLRKRLSRGEAVGAVSTGAKVLGEAGLLDGYRCTIHWEERAAFQLANPRAQVTDAPFEIDRNRYTSAGGAASIDMMLSLIDGAHGRATMRQVANQVLHARIRGADDRQRAAHEPDLSGKPGKVGQVIRLMAESIDEPRSAQDLAQAVNLSVRQVERLFLRHVEMTPTQYYIRLRLARARELLRQTDASVLEVALAAGFTSQSHFAHSYRAAFGNNPSDERKSGAVPAAGPKEPAPARGKP